MQEGRDPVQRETEAEEPQLYLLGGTDELYLEEEGRVFRPGDAMPRTLTEAKRMSLQTAGLRFGTQHPDPEPEPHRVDELGRTVVAPVTPAPDEAPAAVAPGEAIVAPSPDAASPPPSAPSQPRQQPRPAAKE
jgi:hypothetical protein